MNTIKTDIKRAILSIPFLASCVTVVLAIMMGAGGKVLFPKNIEQGLYPFYHIQLVLNALSSNIMLMVVPIICTIPYTSSFLDEYKSGYIKMYLLKTYKPDYVKAKILATGLSGGLVFVIGILTATFLASLVYRPMEIAAPEMVSPLLQIVTKALLYFVCGFLWSSVGMLLANISLSKYMAYASPFVIYYMMVILSERYFRNVYVINPKEWLIMQNYWPANELGIMLLLVLIIIPVVIVSSVAIHRKIEG